MTPEQAEHLQALAPEWEAFCRVEYEQYKEKHKQPFVAHYWSGSAYYDALERWLDDWRKHYKTVGEAWWNSHGFTVDTWPAREPITVVPWN